MISDLIKRLEGAEVGGLELDKAVMLACGITMSQIGFDRWIPAYTTSIDAALALIAEKSPIRGPIMLSIAGSGLCGLEDTDPCGPHIEAFGNTPALACCIALLRAIQGGENADG